LPEFAVPFFAALMGLGAVAIVVAIMIGVSLGSRFAVRA
jgi:hypothetical protein